MLMDAAAVEKPSNIVRKTLPNRLPTPTSWSVGSSPFEFARFPVSDNPVYQALSGPGGITWGLPVIQEQQTVSASCAFFSLLAVDRPTLGWRQA